MRVLPQELLDACTYKDMIGSVKRVVHLKREDGSDCSEGKDACLIVKRISSGWLYYCHRCGFKGAIDNTKSTPDAVLERLNNSKETTINIDKSMKVVIPSDAIPIFDQSTISTNTTPTCARELLLKQRIDYTIVQKHGIVFSPAYRRIIFPIKSTALVTREYYGPTIVGWAGRNPFWVRGSINPKWLIRKSDLMSMKIHHLPADSDFFVVVEDMPSAIRIHNAMEKCTPVHTVTLLGTSLPIELIVRLKETVKNPKVIIWLDHDAIGKTHKYQKVCTTLNVPCKYINTTEDPKAYSNGQIQELILRSIAEHRKREYPMEEYGT